MIGLLAGLMLGGPPRPPQAAAGGAAITTRYQAVTLTNGQVFVGRLEKLDSAFPVLSDIHTLQSKPGEGGKVRRVAWSYAGPTSRTRWSSTPTTSSSSSRSARIRVWASSSRRPGAGSRPEPGARMRFEVELTTDEAGLFKAMAVAYPK